MLPPLQTSVLVTLEEHEPLRLSELARREAVTPPTMSRVLAALDDAGLLVRTPDPQDARSALVELSPEGRAMIEQSAHRADRDRSPSAWRGWRPEHREALAAAVPALEALVACPRSSPQAGLSRAVRPGMLFRCPPGGGASRGRRHRPGRPTAGRE